MAMEAMPVPGRDGFYYCHADLGFGGGGIVERIVGIMLGLDLRH